MIDALIAIISLLIGFYLGTKVPSFEVIEEDGRRIIRKITKLVPKSDLNPGIIKRPSARDLFIRNEEPEKRATNDAMRKTLSSIPELEEARQQVQREPEVGPVVLG